MDELQSSELETALFEASNDVADNFALNTVRLPDRVDLKHNILYASFWIDIP